MDRRSFLRGAAACALLPVVKTAGAAASFTGDIQGHVMTVIHLPAGEFQFVSSEGIVGIWKRYFENEWVEFKPEVTHVY